MCFQFELMLLNYALTLLGCKQLGILRINQESNQTKLLVILQGKTKNQKTF